MFFTAEPIILKLSHVNSMNSSVSVCVLAGLRRTQGNKTKASKHRFRSVISVFVSYHIALTSCLQIVLKFQSLVVFFPKEKVFGHVLPFQCPFEKIH